MLKETVIGYFVMVMGMDFRWLRTVDFREKHKAENYAKREEEKGHPVTMWQATKVYTSRGLPKVPQ